MPDDLPGFSGDMGAGKPLTPAQWHRRELERKALDVYTKTFSFPQVRMQLELRDNDVAEKLVRAGWERYQSEEDDWGAQIYRKSMREGLQDLSVILLEMSRDMGASNQLSAIDRLVKVWERMAKLDDLDKGKDEGGPSVHWHIETRRPDEREVAEVIDEVQNELEAPEDL